jgi:hypothetical protein
VASIIAPGKLSSTGCNYLFGNDKKRPESWHDLRGLSC